MINKNYKYEAILSTVEKLHTVSKLKDERMGYLTSEFKKANESNALHESRHNDVIIKSDGSNLDEFTRSIRRILNAPAKKKQAVVKMENLPGYKGLGECVDAEKELCKSLHNQIDALQRDYSIGAINYARLIDYLKPVKNFLNANMQFAPTYLERDKVEQVISQYL